MGKDDSPQIVRRCTRSTLSNPISKNSDETTKSCDPELLSLNDLVYGDEPMSLDDLLNNLPGRNAQIRELINLLGPINSPIIPLFIYGGPSTGKTTTVLQIFRHLNRPFVYSSCITCYSPRILFESILNQLLLHRKSEGNGYVSAKRCERSSDFVNLLREALANTINNVKRKVEKSSSNKSRNFNGRMVYLIFDNVEVVREWNKGSFILPFLFKIYDILKMPDVGVIFVSNRTPDTYYSDMGYVEPIPVCFPDYSEDDLRKIFLRNQTNPKLYSSFLDVVLKPFFRVTRRLDELATAFSPLFSKYCEPLSDFGVVPNEELKRRLFSYIQPHVVSSLNESFRILCQPSLGVVAKNLNGKQGSGARKSGVSELSEEVPFHMSLSAKYLLISAFLASRNPATLDASLFDPTGGSDNRKRKRKASEISMERKEAAEQELLMKGPGTFSLERLLAIFQCITSVADYQSDDEEQGKNGLGGESEEDGLMSDILLQLSSLCNASFISKGASCPLEGSIRYRSAVSEDLALKVARSLKFPLSKYLYRR